MVAVLILFGTIKLVTVCAMLSLVSYFFLSFPQVLRYIYLPKLFVWHFQFSYVSIGWEESCFHMHFHCATCLCLWFYYNSFHKFILLFPFLWDFPSLSFSFFFGCLKHSLWSGHVLGNKWQSYALFPLFLPPPLPEYWAFVLVTKLNVQDFVL